MKVLKPCAAPRIGTFGKHEFVKLLHSHQLISVPGITTSSDEAHVLRAASLLEALEVHCWTTVAAGEALAFSSLSDLREASVPSAKKFSCSISRIRC